MLVLFTKTALINIITLDVLKFVENLGELLPGFDVRLHAAQDKVLSRASLHSLTGGRAKKIHAKYHVKRDSPPKRFLNARVISVVRSRKNKFLVSDVLILA